MAVSHVTSRWSLLYARCGGWLVRTPTPHCNISPLAVIYIAEHIRSPARDLLALDVDDDALDRDWLVAHVDDAALRVLLVVAPGGVEPEQVVTAVAVRTVVAENFACRL